MEIPDFPKEEKSDAATPDANNSSVPSSSSSSSSSSLPSPTYGNGKRAKDGGYYTVPLMPKGLKPDQVKPWKFLTRIASFKDVETGGFSGGYMQGGHILSTYACVMAMIIIGAKFDLLPHVFEMIDVPSIKRFFWKMKVDDPADDNFGTFRVCEHGEFDTRVVYGMVAVASTLGFLDSQERNERGHTLTQGTADWLLRCQTYEGGLAGEPDQEAHGGYTHCGVAALLLLRQAHRLDLDKMLEWATSRQFEYEGGFCGRTNKLVDGCYSFWLGGLFPLIHYAKLSAEALEKEKVKEKENVRGKGRREEGKETPEGGNTGQVDETKHVNNGASSTCSCLSTTPISEALRVGSLLPIPNDFGWCFDQHRLQRYVTLFSQSHFPAPGLKDKPSKNADFYHTCYCLSGLAVSQHSFSSGPGRYAQRTRGDDGDENEEDEDGNDDDYMFFEEDEDGTNLPALKRNETLELDTSSSLTNVGIEPNPRVYGPKENLLVPINPVMNISDETLGALLAYLSAQGETESAP